MQGAAACVTDNVCPAIVSEPLRWVPLGLAVALKPTVPPPFPLAPLVTVSQEVLLLTPVHAQPVGAVTVVDPVPPADAIDWLAGLIAYVHGAAACVTENVWPAIVSEPLRCVAFGFAAALNATVPVPLPLAPLVTVSHDVLLLTPVHAQPANVVTVVEPVATGGHHRLARRVDRIRARGARLGDRQGLPADRERAAALCRAGVGGGAESQPTRRRCRSRHSSPSATTCCC